MKRTISILALAAPLATVALSLGATPAIAEPAGPEELTQQFHVDPEPGPEIDDKAPLPDEPDEPIDVPDDDITSNPCPTHGGCGDDPDDEKVPDDEDEPGDGDDFDKPNRIDAGTGTTDDGLQLTWLIAGSGLITATGAAYAVRRRARTLA